MGLGFSNLGVSILAEMKEMSKKLFAFGATMAVSALATAQDNLYKSVELIYPELEAMYQDLHANPELSFQEKETSAKLAKWLVDNDFDVTHNVGGYGVVGVLRNGEGKTVLVRTDMDALPIKEETGLSCASNVQAIDDYGNTVPVMHACGHDVHMTVWSGVAQMLSTMQDEWNGTVVFIGQQAEERGKGAEMLLEAGLYDNFPVPDYGLALHCKSELPSGTVGMCSEYALANVESVDITVYGEGGHGAYPHTTIDPVVIASKIVLDLQTIVSREVKPIEPAVITVGSIHGGTKHNITPNEVKLQLTLRSYSDKVRHQLVDAIRRKCNAQAAAAGLPPEKYPKVDVQDEFTPSTYNDPELTARLTTVFSEVLGEDNVYQVEPVMGGEDFGRYGRAEPNPPICLYWLGVVPPEEVAAAEAEGRTLPSLHSPYFAPDAKPAITTGVVTMTAAVLELLAN